MSARPCLLRSAGRPVDQYRVTTCSVCGDTSELEYGYTTVKSATGGATRCATCWKRRRERRELATVMLPLAMLVALALLSGRWESGLPTIRIYPILVLVLWAHELGHATVGRALGLRVFEVVLGSGPRLVRARFGRTDIEARLFPFGGHTVMVPPRPARVRLALGILAGPCANLAVAVVALLVWPRSGSWVPPLVIANTIVLIGNLWPMQVATPLGPVRSDGLALATLIRSPRDELDDADALLHAAESRAALARGSRPPPWRGPRPVCAPTPTTARCGTSSPSRSSVPATSTRPAIIFRRCSRVTTPSHPSAPWT